MVSTILFPFMIFSKTLGKHFLEAVFLLMVFLEFHQLVFQLKPLPLQKNDKHIVVTISSAINFQLLQFS